MWEMEGHINSISRTKYQQMQIGELHLTKSKITNSIYQNQDVRVTQSKGVENICLGEVRIKP